MWTASGRDSPRRLEALDAMQRLKIGFVLVAVVVFAAGGWMWLRDSSLVAVNDIQVSGLTQSDGEQVRGALEQAGRSMTTLHVRTQILRDAVARFPSVG